MALAMGISDACFKASLEVPALKRMMEWEFFRSAEALLPRMNAGAPTKKQLGPWMTTRPKEK